MGLSSDRISPNYAILSSIINDFSDDIDCVLDNFIITDELFSHRISAARECIRFVSDALVSSPSSLKCVQMAEFSAMYWNLVEDIANTVKEGDFLPDDILCSFYGIAQNIDEVLKFLNLEKKPCDKFADDRHVISIPKWRFEEISSMFLDGMNEIENHFWQLTSSGDIEFYDQFKRRDIHQSLIFSSFIVLCCSDAEIVDIRHVASFYQACVLAIARSSSEIRDVLIQNLKEPLDELLDEISFRLDDRHVGSSDLKKLWWKHNSGHVGITKERVEEILGREPGLARCRKIALEMASDWSI